MDFRLRGNDKEKDVVELCVVVRDAQGALAPGYQIQQHRRVPLPRENEAYLGLNVLSPIFRVFAKSCNEAVEPFWGIVKVGNCFVRSGAWQVAYIFQKSAKRFGGVVDMLQLFHLVIRACVLDENISSPIVPILVEQKIIASDGLDNSQRFPLRIATSCDYFYSDVP